MDFSSYRELFAHRQLRKILFLGMFARVVPATAGVVLTLHIVFHLGLSYVQAGTALAILTIGLALGAPWRGRAVDRRGLRAALLPSIVSTTLVWLAVPLLNFQWLLPVCLFAGMMNTPVFSIVRQALTITAGPSLRRSAFAADSVNTELVFMLGPATGAVLATQAPVTVTMVCMAAATLLSGGLLWWANPALHDPHQPTSYHLHQQPAAEIREESGPAGAEHPTAGRLSQPEHQPASGPAQQARSNPVVGKTSWWKPALIPILVSAFGCGVLITAVDVTVVAVLDAKEQAGQLGWVYVAWCGASIIGGMIYGARRSAATPLVLMVILALLVLPLALAQDALSLCLLIIGAGFFTAPTFTAASEALTEHIDGSRQGEIMGYYGSLMTTGSALGAPLAGLAIDTIGPGAGFVAASSVVLAASAVMSLVMRMRRPTSG